MFQLAIFQPTDHDASNQAIGLQLMMAHKYDYQACRRVLLAVFFRAIQDASEVDPGVQTDAREWLMEHGYSIIELFDRAISRDFYTHCLDELLAKNPKGILRNQRSLQFHRAANSNHAPAGVRSQSSQLDLTQPDKT